MCVEKCDRTSTFMLRSVKYFVEYLASTILQSEQKISLNIKLMLSHLICIYSVKFFIDYFCYRIAVVIVIVRKVYCWCLVIYHFASPLYYCDDCFLAHLLYLADSRSKFFGCSVRALIYTKDDVLCRLFLVITSFIYPKVVPKAKAFLRHIPPASQVAINKKLAHNVSVVF